MDESIQAGFQLKVIYSINFTKNHLVISSKNGMVIYSLSNLKIVYAEPGAFWEAVFIPQTDYIVYVKHGSSQKSKRQLTIFDLSRKKIMSTMVLKHQIQQIKVGQNCIAISGLQSLSVVHFPSLKPIYHGVAGTGIHNIFDISLVGLTLIHDCQEKGRVVVHNFTNAEIPRVKKSTLTEKSKMAEYNVKKGSNILEIDAHKQNISLLRLSPNGSRMATASNKGTIIRIFLTSSGELWQQLRVSDKLSRICDMNFYETGNVLSCLNEKNIVKLFNVKLQSFEEQLQTGRIGHKIYQQKNPKSYFSFLSFLNRSLGCDYSFSHFTLVKPEEKEEEEKKEQMEKKESMEKKQSVSENIEVIMQEEEDENKKEIQMKKSQSAKEEKPQIQGIHLDYILNLGKEQANTKESKARKSEDYRPKSISSLSRKNSSFARKKQEPIFIPKVYNTVNKIHVGKDNNIWVIKGYYLYTLKYDPFNGGEMYHLNTMILN